MEMSGRVILSIGLIGIAGLGAYVSMTMPAEAIRRRACMADHFHYGSSTGQPNKRVAKAEAIASWQGFTAFEYGNAFGSFRRARSKKVKCVRESGGRWGCNVEGVPCR
jgi:hypothetical protein